MCHSCSGIPKRMSRGPGLLCSGIGSTSLSKSTCCSLRERVLEGNWKRYKIGDRVLVARRFRSYSLQVRCHLTSCISHARPCSISFLSCVHEPAWQGLSCGSRSRPLGFRYRSTRAKPLPCTTETTYGLLPRNMVLERVTAETGSSLDGENQRRHE